MTTHQKVDVLIIIIYLKGELLKSLTILLSSLVFTSRIFLFSPLILVSMVVMEEKGRRLILLSGLYKVLYKLVRHVVDVQTFTLQREWKKFATFELGFR